jgi:hypothetical protein
LRARPENGILLVNSRIRMGRSYWYECARCGYRAKVSGRADRGLNFFVQTILCQDCKELYDAVIRMKLPDETGSNLLRNNGGFNRFRTRLWSRTNPPSFQAALSRLLYPGVAHFRWKSFRLQCPVASYHRVESWNEPDKCPRCGLYLDRNVLPYRIWD